MTFVKFGPLPPKGARQNKAKRGQPMKRNVGYAKRVHRRKTHGPNVSPVVSADFQITSVRKEYNVFGDLIADVFSSTTGNTIGAYTYKREWQTENTPNFKEVKRKKKNLPLNPHLVRVQKVWGSPFSSNAVSSDGSRLVNTISSASLLDTSPANAYGVSTAVRSLELAKSRISKNFADRKVNLAVAFAERVQTAQLMADTVKRVYVAAISLKRGRLGDAFVALGIRRSPSVREEARVLRTPADKRLAEHWLEVNFGVVPLLNDVHGAAELLAQHIETDVYTETAYSSGKASYNRMIRTQGKDILITESSKSRIGLQYRLDDRAKMILAQTGIRDPMSVLWEVLPYSFVVDWFIPVSSYLAKLQTFDGFTFVRGWHSTTYRATAIKTWFGYSILGGGHCDQSGSSSWKFDEYSRQNYSSFPTFAVPNFRNPLENGPVWKFATSMALLRQVFGR